MEARQQAARQVEAQFRRIRLSDFIDVFPPHEGETLRQFLNHIESKSPPLAAGRALLTDAPA